MFIERVMSFNNGWSILTTQKSEEWAEALEALTLVNDDFFLLAIKECGEEHLTEGIIFYYMYNLYNNFLSVKFGWKDVLPIAKSTVRSHMEQRATKNRVAVSMIEPDAMQTEDFLTSLYVTIPYYYNNEFTEINVILIPTTDAIDYFLKLGLKPSHVTKLPTEDLCREQLTKFGPSNSQAPVVLAFFSPTAFEEIAIEEVVPLKVGEHIIERTIEFAPEYYQAGVGLLSYFGEVLRQKDPNTKAKVRIEQEGNTVRLHIVPPVGEAEIVEKQLEQFALIISNQNPPESLLDNPGQIVQLKAQLRMAQLQIETAYDLKQLTAGKHTQDVQNLERKIDTLTQQLAMQVLRQGGSYELL